MQDNLVNKTPERLVPGFALGSFKVALGLFWALSRLTLGLLWMPHGPENSGKTAKSMKRARGKRFSPAIGANRRECTTPRPHAGRAPRSPGHTNLGCYPRPDA